MKTKWIVGLLIAGAWSAPADDVLQSFEFNADGELLGIIDQNNRFIETVSNGVYAAVDNPDDTSTDYQLRIILGNGDAGSSPTATSFPTGTGSNEVERIEIRYRLDSGSASNPEFRANQAAATQAYVLDAPVAVGQWVVATCDLVGAVANIGSLRFDVRSTVGGFTVDYIRFYSGSAVPPDPDPLPDPIPGAPNIIYIIADDLGYSDPGCYGGEIQTPNIDRLASEGLRFRHFYDCAKCETSRSSLMSGLYHGRSGLNILKGTSIGSALQSGGYRTYAVGKWHLGDLAGRRPTERGFHNYYGHYSGASPYFPSGIGTSRIFRDTAEPNNFISAYANSYFTADSSSFSRQTSFPSDFYLTDAFGESAVEFVNDAVANHTNRPFFMYVAFNAPHTPLQAPVEEINKYRHTYTNGWDVLRQEKWQRQLASGLVDPQWQLPTLRDDIPRWIDLDGAARDAEDHRRAVYAAMVDRMDQNIGKILDRLDELDATTHPGILANTLIMFSSDNGAQAFDNATVEQRAVSPDNPNSAWNMGAGWAAFSNTPWRYYKQSKQQGGICTPFVARWPGTIAAGQTTDQPGHFVDVMATVVDVAGIDYAALTDFYGNPVPPLDGASLLPVFAGGTRPAPDFWGFEFSASEFAVIQGDWKLASFSSGPWRLFNLKDDRTETRNLRWAYPEKVQELAALYDQWAMDTYGNDSRIYAKRDTLEELSQELRYEVVHTGALYSEPSIGITVTNIGTVANASVEDHWEILPIRNAAAGVGGTADHFTFVCKPFFGDGELIAQVESVSNLVAGGQAGVMIRESLAEGSAFVMSSLNASGQVEQSVRSEAGEAAAVRSAGSGIAAPVFLRVQRKGEVFTTSYSTDGLSWTDFASTTNAMGASVHGGLAAASGSAGATGVLVFREWENRDVAQYPGRTRPVDGIPALLGYALGADEQTDATGRLPSIRMTNTVSGTYPEITYSRRADANGLRYGFRGGAAVGVMDDDAENWAEMSVSAGPDADSEAIVVRRLETVMEQESGFFQLQVGRGQ